MITIPRLLVAAICLALAAPAQAENDTSGPLRLTDSEAKVGVVQTAVTFQVRNDLPVKVEELAVILKVGTGAEGESVSEVERVRGPWAPGTSASVKVTGRARVEKGGKSVKVTSYDIDVADAVIARDLTALLLLESSGERGLMRAARVSTGLFPWHPRAAELLAAAKADAPFLTALQAEARRAPPEDEKESEAWLETRTLVAELLVGLGAPDAMTAIAAMLALRGGAEPDEVVNAPTLGRLLRESGSDGVKALLAGVAPTDGALAAHVVDSVRHAWPLPTERASRSALISLELLTAAVRTEGAENVAAIEVLLERTAAGDPAATKIAQEIPPETLLALVSATAWAPGLKARELALVGGKTIAAAALDERAKANDAEHAGRFTGMQAGGIMEVATSVGVTSFLVAQLRSDDEVPAALDRITRAYAAAVTSDFDTSLRVRELPLLALALSPVPSDALDVALIAFAAPMLDSSDRRYASWMLEHLAARAKAPATRAAIAATVSRRATGIENGDLLSLAARIDPNAPEVKERVSAREGEAAVVTTIFWGFWLLLAAILVFAARSGRSAIRTDGVCGACSLAAPTIDATLRYNVGLLIMRREGKIAGHLCKSCLTAHFWRYSAMLVFVGWWGLISAIVTPFYLLANLWNFARAWYLPKAAKRVSLAQAD